MKNQPPSHPVYSTELGRLCPGCAKAINACECQSRRSGADPVGDGIIRIRRETKGRKGKGVSLICGLPLNEKELKALAKQLKQTCGTGGTIREGVIEIQGDQRELLKKELEKRGYRAKIAGG